MVSHECSSRAFLQGKLTSSTVICAPAAEHSTHEHGAAESTPERMHYRSLLLKKSRLAEHISVLKKKNETIFFSSSSEFGLEQVCSSKCARVLRGRELYGSAHRGSSAEHGGVHTEPWKHAETPLNFSARSGALDMSHPLGPHDMPRLDLSTLSARTETPPATMFAPQALRVMPAVGSFLVEEMQRSGSPLTIPRSRSRTPISEGAPAVRSLLDSESRLEAAGALLEELSTLKGKVSVCSTFSQRCITRFAPSVF